MKSWGARIVGRLFNSRTNKKIDSVADEASALNIPDEVKPLQLDQHAEKKLRSEGPEKGSDQTGFKANVEAGHTKEAAEAKMDLGNSLTSEMSVSSLETPNEHTDGPVTLSTASEPLQKASQIRKPKSKGGRIAGKSIAVGEGLADDKASGGQGAVGHGTQKRVINQLSKETSSKASEKTRFNIKSKHRSDELLSVEETLPSKERSAHVDLSMVGQGIAKSSSTFKTAISPLKRTGKQKTTVFDEPVTDKELAELEAENARLKLLLHKKLSSGLLE